MELVVVAGVARLVVVVAPRCAGRVQQHHWHPPHAQESSVVEPCELLCAASHASCGLPPLPGIQSSAMTTSAQGHATHQFAAKHTIARHTHTHTHLTVAGVQGCSSFKVLQCFTMPTQSIPCCPPSQKALHVRRLCGEGSKRAALAPCATSSDVHHAHLDFDGRTGVFLSLQVLVHAQQCHGAVGVGYSVAWVERHTSCVASDTTREHAQEREASRQTAAINQLHTRT